jgi:hypothetical protein
LELLRRGSDVWADVVAVGQSFFDRVKEAITRLAAKAIVIKRMNGMTPFKASLSILHSPSLRGVFLERLSIGSPAAQESTPKALWKDNKSATSVICRGRFCLVHSYFPQAYNL